MATLLYNRKNNMPLAFTTETGREIIVSPGDTFEIFEESAYIHVLIDRGIVELVKAQEPQKPKAEKPTATKQNRSQSNRK